MGKKIPDRDCEGAARQKAAVPQAATIGGVMIWSPDQDELKGLPLLTAVSQQVLGR